ncbi:MAG: hypothetical protein WDO74_09260 [Pseudomonadota bacterium]
MFTPANVSKPAAIALIGCALLLASNEAAAQAAHKSQSAQADLLIHQGQVLLDAGHVEAACAKFESSETLENGLDTLLRLADCYERAGRTASAWHTFLEAEAVAHFKKDSERAQVANQRVAALEPKLTRVVFLVPTTSRVPGLTVQLGANTVPPSSWGAPIPVDAGVQRVSASAKGYNSWSIDIDASHSEGRQFRVNVPTLAPAQGAPAAAARGNGYRTAGVVTGSFGLAGIGAGAVFSAMSRNASDATTCAKGVLQCTPNTSNKSALTDAATLSFALGGALLATGVTLFVLAPSPDNKEKNSLRVAARYAGSGGRLQLEGVW